MRRARRADGCSRSAVVDVAGRTFRQRQEHAGLRALLVKNIHHAIPRSYPVTRPSPHRPHVRTSYGEPRPRHLLISLIPEPALSNLSEDKQMNSPKTGSQKVYTLSSASQSPPRARGSPTRAASTEREQRRQPRALQPLDLLGRDHGVEPREKLLALRLIIERARVLVLCAVR